MRLAESADKELTDFTFCMRFYNERIEYVTLMYDGRDKNSFDNWIAWDTVYHNTVTLFHKENICIYNLKVGMTVFYDGWLKLLKVRPA